MDILWILFAFVCGFGVKQLGLPPLIGYLAAGFMLNFSGVEMTPGLQEIADLGVTLMLFTIGLKLDIRDLLKPQTWAGTLANTGLWTLLFTGLALSLAALSAPYFSTLDWKSAALLAFALSFSSTVCVIKVLEEAGEMSSRHGRFAIGILVMQDVIAVIFLVLAEVFGLLGVMLVDSLFDGDGAGHSRTLAHQRRASAKRKSGEVPERLQGRGPNPSRIQHRVEVFEVRRFLRGHMANGVANRRLA